MKKNSIWYCIAIAISLSSCMPVNYYQVYKVKSVNIGTEQKNPLVYEDNNCKVSYDFWSNGGYLRFEIYNKTDKNLFIDLGKSFFILNGIAYDYFESKTFESRRSISTRTGGAVSYGYVAISTAKTDFNEETISTIQKEVICIPPKSAKIVNEYYVTKSLYRDCNLFIYPSRKQIVTSNFSEYESPFVVRNIISYNVESTDNQVKFENKFYISEITNYPQSQIKELEKKQFCGEYEMKYVQKSKYVAPDKFYIEYKSNEYPMLKH
ncbi:MAG: hypothetical protein LBN23_08305 [Paludibacter sp.]|jgi:hypothetical protein|nr:hypothetical protein [Paludibacter sp.]